MEYRVAFDFKVTRRVSWDQDIDAFHGHVNDVVSFLEESSVIREVKVVVDLAQVSLLMELVVEADTRMGAEELAKSLIGLAIRESGALHIGLFSIGEESKMKSRLNAWAGLRTPHWTPRKVLTASTA
jgi:hypothetical protein